MSISFSGWNIQVISEKVHTTTVYVIPWETWLTAFIMLLAIIVLVLRNRGIFASGKSDH